YFLDFLREESCGKCAPCREGIERMLQILTGVCEGRGKEGDVETLEELGRTLKDFSLCGLGQTAPNPVLSTIRYFRSEYDAHIRDKTCPAGACRKLSPPPCQRACPAGQDASGYVALVAHGRAGEALDLIGLDHPLPGVLGRVCFHPCETACKRGTVDEPVRICALKRFAADEGRGRGGRPSPPPRRADGRPVAVVGSGPAGLSCAWALARAGHRPVVFESLPAAGGMLRAGIPEYRLPRDVLDEEIARILETGVELRLGTPAGTLAGLRAQGFSAVFLATGAHRGLRLGVPGDGEFGGQEDCTAFLREVNLGRRRHLPGKRVAVVGGGNAAVDAARAALRLGAEKVAIVYRRTEAEMPAYAAEVRAAREEGIEFVFLASPARIAGRDGRVAGIECVRNELGEPDASGRRRPVPVPGSGFLVEADGLIAAVGQEPDLEFLGPDRSGLAAGPNRALRADPVTLAAEDEALKRAGIPSLPPGRRVPGFAEVDLGLSEEAARKEARRCLRCDLSG
ncbi:MAG: FAD-dependent oxidoreductase, partial [Planctomycetes bacterium]|nr:FAD-dependent oxidoreductase [Planctomycetota bacterium]